MNPGCHFVETIHCGDQKTVYVSGFGKGKSKKIPENGQEFPPGNPFHKEASDDTRGLIGNLRRKWKG